MIKKLKEKIKTWCRRHIDYKITGGYYDTDDKGRYVKKYHKRYYVKLK